MKKINRFIIVAIILFFAAVFNFARAAVAGAGNPQGIIQETTDANGITKMIVSENGLNQFAQEIIKSQLKGYIKSASVKIFDGYVEVTAVAQNPIPATLFVRAQINVANGNLYPKILKMNYGFFPIPNFLMNFFIGMIVGQNSQNFQSTGVEIPGIEWHSVVFKNGQVTVEFKETN